MWAELAKFVNANTKETILITIIGTLLVWMYKQFKGMIDRDYDDKLTMMQTKQRLFMKLELSIASVIHLNNEESKQQMYTHIGDCGPYLTAMQRTVIREYYKQFDLTKLQFLQALTVSQVEKIGRELDKMKELKEDNEWFAYIIRLLLPFGPIVVFICIALYVLLVNALLVQAISIGAKVYILLCSITLLASMLFLCVMIHLFIKRNMAKHGIKRWISFILFIGAPSLIFFFNRIDLSVICIAIQVASGIYISISKLPRDVITP